MSGSLVRGDGRGGLWRSRWAAIGAAVAVTLGGGGLFVANAASGPASSVVTIDPVRILDTRTGVGLVGPFVSGVPRKLQVAGGAVPAGATGGLLNVTVVAPSAAGFLSVRPGDATGAPSTSSLNFVAGDVVPNSVQVGLPTTGANAGKIDITYDAFGQVGPTTEVLIDAVGYLVAGGAGTSGPVGPQGPAGAQGATGVQGTQGVAGGNGPVPGTACTAGGVSGAATSGFNLTGVFVVHCFRNQVTTLAGNTFVQGFADGSGTNARFNNPYGVAVDGAGNVYVADVDNHRIRKITPAGAVTTLAGDGTTTPFNHPGGVAVDGTGNVYVADSFNNRIRKITPGGAVTTFAGSTDFGSTNGNGTIARFRSPQGVAVDGAGNVYVADTSNHQIRKITPGGDVSTLAGSTQGFADGNGALAQFFGAAGVAVDGAGNVYVADAGNHRIRKITPAGAVTTVAGSTLGFADGNGTNARFRFPYGVAVDGAGGNVYVADPGNSQIRHIR